ncbi:MAG TPA: SUMF1/EgtB/PvdO family nonheme iron enzyme [Polyangiaceae bacterium]|nr:SUMF1/EgtB/PvdO family nonheme iron enzyme [Polyangiaceae bacterium]
MTTKRRRDFSKGKLAVGLSQPLRGGVGGQALLTAALLFSCAPAMWDDTEPGAGGGAMGGASGAPAACATEVCRPEPPSAPLAVIRYATQVLQPGQPYPFGPEQQWPTLGVGDRLYLSAADSHDPTGGVLRFRWSVEPPGSSASFDDTAAAEVVLSSLPVGDHRVLLAVSREADRTQLSRAELALRVAARRCAEDGASGACAEALLVPAGSFARGSPKTSGDVSEHPEHSAHVAAFFLDRYEVTVGRFQRFLAAAPKAPPKPAAGAHPLIPQSGWRSEWNQELSVSSDQLELALVECGATSTGTSPDRDALPMSCVSWYEAFAFCVWDGGRLPTEAEWEYAAAGGDEDRMYPWGSQEPVIARAIFGCLFDSRLGCLPSDLPPVGNAPAGSGRFGHEDMAGSLWEWTLDHYAAYDARPCDNCAVLDRGEGRVFRGGDFSSEDTSVLRSATRYAFLPEYRDAARGFRCARAAAMR